MESWQLRVISEANELRDRIELLDQFLLCNHTPKLSIENEFLLHAQLSYMRLYYEVLQERIERFIPRKSNE